mmetsp:Transcript_11294/g.25944  ORF Transcript_11294/g.25944 Transcript_11294/m.25944 type:complete len:189 (-) Transcript_11294:2062-2628(-)
MVTSAASTSSNGPATDSFKAVVTTPFSYSVTKSSAAPSEKDNVKLPLMTTNCEVDVVVVVVASGSTVAVDTVDGVVGDSEETVEGDDREDCDETDVDVVLLELGEDIEDIDEDEVETVIGSVLEDVAVELVVVTVLSVLRLDGVDAVNIFVVGRGVGEVDVDETVLVVVAVEVLEVIERREDPLEVDV